jgi:hypothetical protein
VAEPKILVFAGSLRTGSLNETLAAYVARQLRALGADISHISLADFPMPIYNGDLEAGEGVPENAKKFCALIYEHQGVFIIGPEYNAGITRQVLELGCGAFVQPEMISVFYAAKNYDEGGDLTEPGTQKSARRAVDALYANARRYLQ